MKNLPNILTSIRFFLVPVFVVAYWKWAPVAALAVFIVASLTDLLDGYIARKNNLITDWGKVMDPLADKIMQIAVLICLYMDAAIPLFVLVTVAVKETVMVAGGVFLYKRRDTVVFSKYYGKIATALFFLGIVLTFFREATAPFNLYVIYVALAISLLSMVMYGISALFKKDKPAQGA